MQSTSRKYLIAGVLVLVIVVIGAYVAINSHKTVTEIMPSPTPVVNTWPTQTVIGKSVQGRKIDAYIYSRVATTTPASQSGEGAKLNGNDVKNLLFVGGIHGGYEWNSVLLAYQLMDYLTANPNAIPANITVTVIPSANPDAVFKVVGKEGRFVASDVTTDERVLESARFNADNVDLNRNFDCKWQAKGTWKSMTVSAGTAAFSEPESRTIRNYILANNVSGAVFWHSQSNAVYASQCEKGILPTTLDIMNVYAKASGYPAVKTFDAYTTTGAADDWMASIGIPALTVELSTHNTIEWDRNLAGVKALIGYFSQK